MTYTMGRRAIGVFKDRGAQREAEFEANVEGVIALVETLAYLIVGVLYIVFSPILLLGKLFQVLEARKVRKAKSLRYQRYLQKQAQK